MNTAKMLKLESVGETKIDVDGKEYVQLTFSDSANFLAEQRSRNFFQKALSDGTFAWSIPSPDKLRKLIGRELPGEIVSKEVPAYEVGDRTVTSYTTVVLGNENVASVFKAAKHPIDGQAIIATPEVSELADAKLIS